MRKGSIIGGAIIVGLAMVADIVGVTMLFKDQWVPGMAMFQMATFLVLFAIWMDR